MTQAAQIASYHRYHTQGGETGSYDILGDQSFAEDAHQRFKKLYMGDADGVVISWHPDWPPTACNGAIQL